MFKHQYKVLIVIICGLLSYLVFYPSFKPEPLQSLNKALVKSLVKSAVIASDSSIDTLMELSGISKQVDQFPALFKGSMQQSAQQGMLLSSAEYNAVIESINSSVLPSDILRGISGTLKSELKQDEADALIAWYQSALGKKIASAEESSQTEQAYQKMVEQKQSLLSNAERVAFAERFDVLLGATEMTSKIQQNVQVAVSLNIALALNPDRPIDKGALKVELQNFETEINQAVEQMVITSFIFSYQSLASEELIQYETFLNQASTKKFNKLIFSSLNYGLENAILSWLDNSAVSLATIELNDSWE